MLVCAWPLKYAVILLKEYDPAIFLLVLTCRKHWVTSCFPSGRAPVAIISCLLSPHTHRHYEIL